MKAAEIKHSAVFCCAKSVAEKPLALQIIRRIKPFPFPGFQKGGSMNQKRKETEKKITGIGGDGYPGGRPYHLWGQGVCKLCRTIPLE